MNNEYVYKRERQLTHVTYKKFRNQNLSKQRKPERAYYQEQFELNRNDLRNSWKVIKNIIQKSEINC